MGLEVSEGEITEMKVKGKSGLPLRHGPAVGPASLPPGPTGHAHHSCSGTCQASRTTSPWSYTINRLNIGILAETSCSITTPRLY